MSFTPTPHPGVLHHYSPKLVAFEHRPGQVDTDQPHNFVLFVGGLGDTLLSDRYPSVLATFLPATWAIIEVHTRSSGLGWATGTLERDSEDLSKAIAYFRDLAKQRNAQVPAKVVLFGHSTGCQDAVNYLVGPWKAASIPQEVLDRPRLDGVVLQAGISDREGMANEGFSPEQIRKSLEVAHAMIDEGRGGDYMPTAVVSGTQTSANRWVSLQSEDGDDDYFSSDLGEDRLQRVWGKRGLATRDARILVLLSGEDEHMPESVDKAKLAAQWEGYVRDNGGSWDERSGVLPGASHNLNISSNEAVKGLCDKAVDFIQSIDSDHASRL